MSRGQLQSYRILRIFNFWNIRLVWLKVTVMEKSRILTACRTSKMLHGSPDGLRRSLRFLRLSFALYLVLLPLKKYFTIHGQILEDVEILREFILVVTHTFVINAILYSEHSRLTLLLNLKWFEIGSPVPLRSLLGICASLNNLKTFKNIPEKEFLLFKN